MRSCLAGICGVTPHVAKHDAERRATLNPRHYGLAVCLAFTVASIGLAASASLQADDAKSIQGTWQVVSLSKGSSPPPKEYANAKMRITADKLIMITGDKEEPIKYRLNPKTNPKEIDLFVPRKIAVIKKDGAKDKETTTLDVLLRGIYELNGDELMICFHTPPRPAPTKDKIASKPEQQPESVRPKAFKSAEDTVLLVLKRTK